MRRGGGESRNAPSDGETVSRIRAYASRQCAEDALGVSAQCKSVRVLTALKCRIRCVT